MRPEVMKRFAELSMQRMQSLGDQPIAASQADPVLAFTPRRWITLRANARVHLRARTYGMSSGSPLGYTCRMSPARNSKDKASAGTPRAPGRKPRVQGSSGSDGAVKRIPAGRLPDLAPLTDDELAALIRVAERELSARRDQKRAAFFSTLREQAQALGVAPEEIAAELGRKNAKRPTAASKVFDRRASVAPKYRNPENPSETWAGRGVKPRWMQALLARGRTMDEFKIAP